MLHVAALLTYLVLPARQTPELPTPTLVGGRQPFAGRPDASVAGTPGDGLTLNAGTLTLADFDLDGATPLPHDGLRGRAPSGPRDPLVNPLGRAELLLGDLDETVLFSPSYGVPAGVSWIREDFRAGQGTVPGTAQGSAQLGQIHDVAAGNIDGDPEDEIVLLQQLDGASLVGLVRVDRAADGSYLWTELGTLAGGSFVPREGRVVLGDFDGDLRDELAVTLSDKPMGEASRKSWLRVYDDPESGGAEMLFRELLTNHVGMWAESADLDGDGLDELVQVVEGNSTSAAALVVRTFHCGRGQAIFPALQPQAAFFALHEAGTNLVGCKLAVGNFDRDPAQEVMFVALRDGTPSAPQNVRLRPFQYAAGVWSSIGGSTTLQYSAPSSGSARRGAAWDVVAVDRFGRGRDEIALFRGRAGGNLTLEFLEFHEGAWTASTPSALDIARASVASSGLSLAVGDGNGDGAEDLYFAAQLGAANPKPLVYGNLRGGLGNTPAIHSLQNVHSDGPGHAPALATGDFDADGFRVRFTGRQTLGVSDPIPLVLLSAAPTKSGISQNHADSATSYHVGSASQAAVGVSSGAAFSVETGFEAEVLQGLFSASVKGRVEASLAKTETHASRTTFVQGFTGSAEADVLVFQANLYRSSEYEIVSAPEASLVGTTFTLDVPVDSNLYKWTVEFYNPRVNPSFRIGADLRPHQVGAPETYHSTSQVQTLLDAYVGWRNPNEASVGQGSGTNSLSIELASEHTSEEQRESTLSVEVGFKVVASVSAFSYAATRSEMVSISTSEFTTYEASVGDIASPADYLTWSYDFGLATYQAGRLADAANQPTGFEPGAFPLTVVTFWTDPTGSGY